MRKFDTKVQYLKYKVLREVARLAWNDTLLENLFEIPKTIVPGNTPTMRCCVYKERAILSERVKIAIGSNPNIIEVIAAALFSFMLIAFILHAISQGRLRFIIAV